MFEFHFILHQTKIRHNLVPSEVVPTTFSGTINSKNGSHFT
jgi:hypothetical protein